MVLIEKLIIEITDLSLDARLLYASDSITDILGYAPYEVIGKSCWEYFHPEEIPFARAVHGRGVQLDKAAVLSYCQIKNRWGHWIGCECVFTVVHDVVVACTSIYRRGMKSQKRAVEAPIIRRLFSSSPRDPRYHMLSLLSSKFSSVPKAPSHEPRAALFLNRFSRTLTIMYATNAISSILGVSADELKGKSFYYCIQENCLHEAVRCLESAKANDSIAYLRFWFRDPRAEDHQDENMEDAQCSEEDEDDGGVHLTASMELTEDGQMMDADEAPPLNSRSSSGNSTDLDGQANDIFDAPSSRKSSASSLPLSLGDDEQRIPRSRSTFQREDVEVEAVVSCTSDGLVVILRRARPIIPNPLERPAPPAYANGLFASPWATEPILPSPPSRPQSYENGRIMQDSAPSHASTQNVLPAAGPTTEDFMNSIREVAVFAWSLTGINGSLAQYSRGRPVGESQPPDGFPIWDPKWENPNADPQNEFQGNGGFHDGVRHFKRSPCPREHEGSNQYSSTGMFHNPRLARLQPDGTQPDNQVHGLWNGTPRPGLGTIQPYRGDNGHRQSPHWYW
ncbi:MAG: hypothetical protein M1827_003968 [Pycnora praestabilis]|nr:MAG: hypothetical protein M1827_003968 [Pycnora praestabilis]